MAEDFSADGMLDMYLYENGQLLEQLEATTLEKKDADSFDEADINEFFRVMHTIKGSSGIMMFDDIMKLAHKLEDVFYFIRESKPDNVPHMELVEQIFQVSDFISAEFDKIRDGGDPDGDAKELIDELDVFLKKIKNMHKISLTALQAISQKTAQCIFSFRFVICAISQKLKISILPWTNAMRSCIYTCRQIFT